MHTIQKKKTLRHFGISQKGIHEGTLHRMFMQDIKDAIDEQQLVALIGQFGSGKTTLFDFLEQKVSARRDSKYRFVRVATHDKENLTINNIANAIIYDLSKEAPRRSKEARDRQIARIAGELAVGGGKRICIVVENAHRMHANTLMAIKDLMEAKYNGHSPLFSIALIGHGTLKNKLGKWEEVLWRTMILDLEKAGWMNYQERIDYLESVYGKAITPGARDRIALRTRVPLEMEFFLNEKMEEAKKAGKEVIDEEVIPATLEQRYHALKQGGDISVSYGKISDISGVPKSSVSDTIKGKSSTHKDKVQQAIAELEQELRGDNNQNRQHKEAV